METEYIKKTGLERQKEVLIEALERAAKRKWFVSKHQL